MDLLEWINVGEVSAERDENLSEYFFDNNVLKNVINNKNSFLVLGRKGAGKTAAFQYLLNNKIKICQKKDINLNEEDILLFLSFEDYNWNIHSLLMDNTKSTSLAYKQSWKLIIFIESIRALKTLMDKKSIKVTKQIVKANELLEKIFDSPVPSISKIVSKKLLSLSKISLPKADLELDEGEIDNLEVDAGSIQFEEIKILIYSNNYQKI